MNCILLVEDNYYIQNINSTALEMRGYRVLTAGTFAQGLACAQREAPDLIVLDILLPDGSGLQLCRALRAEGIGVPILFLTAIGESEDVLKGLSAGGDGYITKPYDLDTFLAKVEALL